MNSPSAARRALPPRRTSETSIRSALSASGVFRSSRKRLEHPVAGRRFRGAVSPTRLTSRSSFSQRVRARVASCTFASVQSIGWR